MTEQKTLVPKRRFKEYQNTNAWEQFKLSDVAEYYDGTHQTPKYTDEGVKFISVENIKNIWGTDKYISENDYEKQFKIKPQINDIFMTRITAGVIGDTALVEQDEPLAYYVSLALLRPKSIVPLYLEKYINSPLFKNELHMRIIHTAFPKKINLGDIGECGFRIPNSKKEQVQIGEFFKQLDDTITLHQHKLEKTKALKSAYLSEMFPAEGECEPRRRFAGFTDAWEQRALGDMMEVTSVKRIHQSDWTEKGVRFLRARDIVSASKGEEPADYLYISKEKYDEYSQISGKVKVGDLLVTGVGSIGIPLLVEHEEPLYFKDGNVIWFKNENQLDGNFLYYSFIGKNIQKYIRDVAGIGTVGTYTIDSGKKTPIQVPNISEQRKVGAFFRELDHLITLHQRKLEKLQSIKKAYLNEMFV